MEHYKYNMAECCHAGMWQEDILGKTCLDCGVNTFHNDCGMYDKPEKKGLLTRINEEMEKLKPKKSFPEFISSQEFAKVKKAFEEYNEILLFTPYKREDTLNLHYVFSKRERLDYLFTQLNPEE